MARHPSAMGEMLLSSVFLWLGESSVRGGAGEEEEQHRGRLTWMAATGLCLGGV